MTARSGFLILFKKACIRGLGTAKCNHHLKFTGCIDEKDIFISRYVAGGM
ncbi:putative cytoplasmic protein [Enterobacter hormaechei]|nr:putative cytoplasmic protein [Enterobacter hormaechei]